MTNAHVRYRILRLFNSVNDLNYSQEGLKKKQCSIEQCSIEHCFCVFFDKVAVPDNLNIQLKFFSPVKKLYKNEKQKYRRNCQTGVAFDPLNWAEKRCSVVGGDCLMLA